MARPFEKVREELRLAGIEPMDPPGWVAGEGVGHLIDRMVEGGCANCGARLPREVLAFGSPAAWVAVVVCARCEVAHECEVLEGARSPMDRARRERLLREEGLIE